jgi:tetratricopeptide (TPR) repeat protein
MMDEGGGGAGSAQRAQVKELGELLKAFDERPGDPSLAAKLLAYPLERRAWEGLGEDVDAALVDMALLAGNAARAFGKQGEAIGWYDAALEPCERAAAASEEGSPKRMEARARLVRTLVGMAANRWELSERNPRYLDEAVSYLERAMRIAEELVAEDAGHSGLLASCQCRLGHVYGDLKRPDDARPLFERAAEVLWPMIGTTWETSSTLSGDPRLLLISALIGLDRTEEAHNVLERALLEGQQPGKEGRFDARSFASFAFSWATQLALRDIHTESAWWAERAASLFDSMPYRTPRDVESLAGANTLMGCCRFEAAEASADAARARGEPAEIDPAEADRAIASCQRAVDLAASIEGRALDGLAIFASTATFIAKFYAMTGRPEQALEAYERADALMPRFGVTRETRPAVIAFEEGFHRSECLRSAGRDAEAVRWIEQALTTIDRVEGEVVNKEGARAHLCAQLLAIAEQTGIEARLDAAGFVIGSALLARVHLVAGRIEEAARWIERSEAARKEASLPAPAHLDNLAETARYVGDSLHDQGRYEEANSFWSRAAAMFDELERPDPSSRERQAYVLSRLSASIIAAAWPGIEAALSAEPLDTARFSDLIAEPIRLYQRSGEVLMTLIDELPDAAGKWATNQSLLASSYRYAGRREEALKCYDGVIELHEQGRAGITPSDIADAWRGRATCLGELGRRAEALRSWQKAEEHAEASGDPELLEKIRAEMAEAASGLAEGAVG